MVVIELDQVSKAYRLGAGQTSLREAMMRGIRSLLNRKSRANSELFWALKDVSFQVAQGEVLGIVGHNGAGKSTLLKLLSKVTSPTAGRIRFRGRMASLIELGAGFHPDLSGRENIYLNGAILGLKKREIDEQLSSIIEFAGLEEFIDTPVKRYSSGMYVRLAFAIASHVRADILLVDEVLSVGDLSFQGRSHAKMRELRDEGATIIFVSHNLAAVNSFCDRALLMHRGRMVMSGRPSDVIQTYERLERESMIALLHRNGASDSTHGNPGAVIDRPFITKMELLNTHGEPATEFAAVDGAILRCHFIAPKKIRRPDINLRIRRLSDGLLCCTPSLECDPLEGEGVIEIRVAQWLLMPGVHTAQLAIYDVTGSNDTAVGEQVAFSILGSPWDEAGAYLPVTEWEVHSTQLRPPDLRPDASQPAR